MFTVNLKFPISGNLNKSGIIKNGVGVVSVGTLGYVGYRWDKYGFNKNLYGGFFISAAAGIVYLILDNKEYKRDCEEREKERQHEEKIAKIKHQHSSVSPDNDKDAETPKLRPAKHIVGEGKNIDYLIPHFIRKDGFVIIYADKSVGKSILAHQIARDIATGTPCEAFPKNEECKPQRVIYLDAELTKGDHVERGYQKIHNLDCYIKDEFNYPTIKDMMQDVERLIWEVKGDCTVVLDCISSYKFGTSLASHTEMLGFNQGLDDIRKRAKEDFGAQVSFIVVNHANKGDKDVMKGCQEFEQNATCIIRISKVDGHADYRKIEIARNRDKGEGDFWIVRMMPNTKDKPVHYVVEEKPASPPPIAYPQNKQWKNEDQEERYKKYCFVVELKKQNKSWKEIQAECGVSKQSFQNYKKEFGKL